MTTLWRILLLVTAISTVAQPLAFGRRTDHSSYIPKYWHQREFSPSKQRAESATVADIICPDKSTCLDHDTCCQAASGEHRCCPFPQAVCCSDHIHCCPSGSVCDPVKGNCHRGTFSVPWSESHPANVPTLKYHLCPDDRSQCADEQTCCLKLNGEYGCCHHPKAVCCSDRVHCCPSGTTCDSEGKCQRGRASVPWSESHPANVPTLKYHLCPDGESQCADEQTCCLKLNGEYGCCHHPKAVCCSDHIHCCPNGTTCDVAQGKCNRGKISIPWFEKKPAKVVTVKDVMCPDGQSSCPDGSTCCQLQSGQYGCCPFPKAVCCSDHVHCCPDGTSCDVAQGKCIKGGDSMLWFEKQPSRSVKVKTVVVICPDGQSQCPTKNTCCRKPSGEYDCCAPPNTVCCKDKGQCCPHDETCGLRGCRKKPMRTSFVEYLQQP